MALVAAGVDREVQEVLGLASPELVALEPRAMPVGTSGQLGIIEHGKVYVTELRRCWSMNPRF